MKLIWLDIETTGLNPETDSILEVAAFEATLERPFDVRPLYECVLMWPHKDAGGMVVSRSIDPFVATMHTQNRLLSACAESIMTAGSIEIDLLRRIPLDEDKAVLAGSSVHFDAAFLRHHMPLLFSRFSHRHYDVSAIKLFAQSLGMPKFKKAEAHRARADVLESVEHARAVAQWFADSASGKIVSGR